MESLLFYSISELLVCLIQTKNIEVIFILIFVVLFLGLLLYVGWSGMFVGTLVTKFCVSRL